MSELRQIPILSILPPKRFHSCVLTTYSFDFNYFNHEALAGLSRAGVRNICVYVDDSMLQQYLGNLSGYTSGVAKRYSLSSITRQGAFHPKISLFFGRDGHGFLIIGSGNLTAAGHGHNHEIWGAFHIDGPNDQKAPLFKQAWEYAKKIGSEVPGMSMRKLEWIETHTPWLRDIKQAEQPFGFDIGNGIKAFFLSNAGRGILHDLKAIVQEDVLECTVVSAFFDNKAAVLFELEKLYQNANIHIIVQPSTCTGDFSDKTFERVQFFDWNAIVQEKPQRYLHAKLLHIRTTSSEYCLFGSANLTAPALGTADISPSNEEVCLLIKRDKGNWLEELGLSSKGEAISVAEIPNQGSDSTAEENPIEQHRFRLKAIDRINTRLHIYMEKDAALQNAFLVLFDGWGEEQCRILFLDNEFKEDPGYYDIITDKFSEEVLFGQLFDDKTAISNKQIIHDIVALSRSNPDPNTQRLEEVLDRIEFSDAEMIEILSYLDPDDLTHEKILTTGKTGKKENKENKEGNGSDETLSYEEFTKISPEFQSRGEISHLYGTHRIERILETLKTIFEKLKIQDIDVSNQDEEADKEAIESSPGRIDEESSKRCVPRQTLSAFISLQKTVVKFFDQYIAILEKQRQKKHRVNVLDASMFAIALHLLLDFLDKPIRIKKKIEDEECEEILLRSDGKYFEQGDYCRIATDIIGKFTMLLINGIDDANDEFVRRRIEKCRQMAFWHAVCCIARLAPFKCKNENFTNNWLVWKWELGLNLRYFFAPDDANNETVAREEIEHRIKMSHCIDEKLLFSKTFDTWMHLEKLSRHYKNQNLTELNECKPFKKGSNAFSKYVGFSHLIQVSVIDSGYHKVTFARAGYPPSKRDIFDFEEQKQYIAEIAKIRVLDELDALDEGTCTW